MQCKDVQFQVATGKALDADATQHRAECQDCSDFTAFEQRLTEQLKDWRDEDPSPFLVARMRGGVEPSPKKPVERLFYLGGGLAAAGLAIAFLMASPQRAVAADVAFHRMEGKVAAATSLHLTVFWRPGKGNVEDGPLAKICELWWKPGAWREEASANMGGDRIKLQGPTGTTFNRYDPQSGKLWQAKELAPQPSDFSLRGVASQFMDIPNRYEQAYVDGSTELIVVTNPGSWTRILFSVDPKTELPKHAEKQYRSGDQWLTSGRLDFEFNGTIPAKTFQPSDLIPRP